MSGLTHPSRLAFRPARSAVVAICMAAAAAEAGAQQPSTAASGSRLLGVVLDSAQRPLAGTHVSVLGTSIEAVSDSDGVFRLLGVPPGLQVVELRHLGYRVLTLPLEFTNGLELMTRQRMHPTAVELGPVVVKAAASPLSPGLQGFDARRRLGRGQFVTREEFELYAPSDVETVLRRFHSLQVIPSADGPIVVSARGMIVKDSRNSACTMQLGLDGQLMPANFTIDEVSIEDVQGIEVYAGPATVPPQFVRIGQDQMPGQTDKARAPTYTPQTDTQCGLVMFWTREK